MRGWHTRAYIYVKRAKRVKKTFRAANVETIIDMAKVVHSTTNYAINIPQLIATQEQMVYVYKWSEFLELYFKPILSSFLVFFFEKRQNFLWKTSASLVEEVSTLRRPDCNISSDQLPKQIPLKGRQTMVSI